MTTSRSERGLDWFAFFLADVQTGWGPFVAAYLTSVAWTQFDIGRVLTIGTLTGLLLQVPAGAVVDRVIAYRTVPAHEDSVALSAVLEADAITFTSGSTVRHFVERLDPASLGIMQTKLIVCIGPSTAQAARAAGLTPTAVATAATEDGLIEALLAAR